jgi:hypothetical protein
MGDPSGPAWLVAVETSAIAHAMREWLWLYPIVEIIHITGFVILVGAAAMFDLRLLGVSREVSVTHLARHLLPWSVSALLLIVPAGLLMFSAHATEFAQNTAFLLKLTLIAFAGINALAFHLGAYRSVARWERGVTAPPTAKLNALLSLGLWVGVISCGRLLAYL